MGVLLLFDIFTFLLGSIIFCYQAFCIVVGLFGKPIIFPESKPHKFAVIVAARNEENVIADLVSSVKRQKYPSDYLDVWVCADNCTDNTAVVAKNVGACVIERKNDRLIGKGYALQYLFANMEDKDQYDGFIVFDADNLLDENYISEMNKVFAAGYEVITSYRNSKNFGTNWVSSGSAIWFVRESTQINFTRMKIGGSCQVGGTGFLFSKRIMERNNGWKHHLLTEDIEFSMDCLLHGDKIGYCGTAIFYDEQPLLFSHTCIQRLRWAKGMLQVFKAYGPSLIRDAVRSGQFSMLDLMLFIFPWAVCYLIRLGIGFIFVGWGLVSFNSQVHQLLSMLITAGISLVVLMALAAITVIAQRDKLRASTKQMVVYVLTFPVYVASYMVISTIAVFSKVEWKQIPHGQVPNNGHNR